MRYFRRLPLFLRVTAVLGLLFSLAAIAVFVAAIVSFITSRLYFTPELVNDPPATIIAINLSTLSGACSFTVHSYSARFRQPGRGPFLFDSWQSQARAIALLAALPLCVITLALIIPPPLITFFLVYMLSLLAAGVLIVAYLWMDVKTHFGLERTLQTW